MSIRGRFEIENLATQLLSDVAAVGLQQRQAQKISSAYHQSQQASRGIGKINQTATEQQWASQFINDAEMTANTPLPAISLNVNDEALAEQLGAEASHFHYQTSASNRSSFWQRSLRSVENVLEHRALIAEGRAAAYSEVMRESVGNVADNQQPYVELGYRESIAQTRAAKWTARLLFSSPLAKLSINAAKTAGVVDRWGFFGRDVKIFEEYTYNAVENPGPLSELKGNPASNFASGKYNMSVLNKSTDFYRVGKSGGGRNALGQWFTREPLLSELQSRIDLAIRPRWYDSEGNLIGESPIQSSYKIHFPTGTRIYEGPVGYQGDFFLGGQNKLQIYIDQPWTIEDIKIYPEKPLGR